jgi:hypothetical protein
MIPEIGGVLKLFADAWAQTPYAAMTLRWPNDSNVDPDPTVSSAWMRVTILQAPAVALEIQGQKQRLPAIFELQIFTKPGTGDLESRAIASRAIAELRALAPANGLRFVPEGTRYTGVGLSGGWYQANLSMPFRIDGSL